MGWKTYLLFVTTTWVVCLVPGPAALLVTVQAAGRGLRGAYWAIVGIALANAVYFALSATGLATLVVASATLFNLIKWGGVAYLFYLGLLALSSRAGAVTLSSERPPAGSGLAAFRQALIVELGNPKALLYFVALLPQFVDVQRPIVPQMLLYGLTTILLDLSAYSVYAWLGSRTQRFLSSPRFVKVTNRAAGSLLVVAGVMMAAVRQG
ncbi:LysE family translocator [Archangium lipolyticum]|uniref:LysE family translocator n=1 Tax=Archangium lipolyticum TaxID=2970465 RepID=UPI00214A3A19|nr:LysE family translocator [Archangium lipolyticum]